MDEFFLASLVLGAVTGVSAGLFGIGGGVIIVPVLESMLKNRGIPDNLVMIMAIATSLACIIFTASSSTLAHHRRRAIWWKSVFHLGCGIIIGVVLGAILTEHTNADHLRVIFSIFLFYVGMQMLLAIEAEPSQKQESVIGDYLMGLITGTISSILGTGGGTLIAPYLVVRQVPIKNAAAISSACGLPIAICASVSYAILGFKHGGLPEHTFGYIYLPAFFGIALCSVMTAPLGAKLAHSLPADKLKRYFSIVLFALAAKMLWH